MNIENLIKAFKECGGKYAYKATQGMGNIWICPEDTNFENLLNGVIPSTAIGCIRDCDTSIQLPAQEPIDLDDFFYRDMLFSHDVEVLKLFKPTYLYKYDTYVCLWFGDYEPSISQITGHSYLTGRIFEKDFCRLLENRCLYHINQDWRVRKL